MPPFYIRHDTFISGGTKDHGAFQVRDFKDPLKGLREPTETIPFSEKNAINKKDSLAINKKLIGEGGKLKNTEISTTQLEFYDDGVEKERSSHEGKTKYNVSNNFDNMYIDFQNNNQETKNELGKEFCEIFENIKTINSKADNKNIVDQNNADSSPDQNASLQLQQSSSLCEPEDDSIPDLVIIDQVTKCKEYPLADEHLKFEITGKTPEKDEVDKHLTMIDESATSIPAESDVHSRVHLEQDKCQINENNILINCSLDTEKETDKDKVISATEDAQGYSSKQESAFSIENKTEQNTENRKTEEESADYMVGSDTSKTKEIKLEGEGSSESVQIKMIDDKGMDMGCNVVTAVHLMKNVEGNTADHCCQKTNEMERTQQSKFPVEMEKEKENLERIELGFESGEVELTDETSDFLKEDCHESDGNGVEEIELSESDTSHNKPGDLTDAVSEIFKGQEFDAIFTDEQENIVKMIVPLKELSEDSKSDRESLNEGEISNDLVEITDEASSHEVRLYSDTKCLNDPITVNVTVRGKEARADVRIEKEDKQENKQMSTDIQDLRGSQSSADLKPEERKDLEKELIEKCMSIEGRIMNSSTVIQEDNLNQDKLIPDPYRMVENIADLTVENIQEHIELIPTKSESMPLLIEENLENDINLNLSDVIVTDNLVDDYWDRMEHEAAKKITVAVEAVQFLAEAEFTKVLFESEALAAAGAVEEAAKAVSAIAEAAKEVEEGVTANKIAVEVANKASEIMRQINESMIEKLEENNKGFINQTTADIEINLNITEKNSSLTNHQTVKYEKDKKGLIQENVDDEIKEKETCNSAELSNTKSLEFLCSLNEQAKRLKRKVHRENLRKKNHDSLFNNPPRTEEKKDLESSASLEASEHELRQNESSAHLSELGREIGTEDSDSVSQKKNTPEVPENEESIVSSLLLSSLPLLVLLLIFLSSSCILDEEEEKEEEQEEELFEYFSIINWP